MSNLSADGVATGAQLETVNLDEIPSSASFREFLEAVPPGELRRINQLREPHATDIGWVSILCIPEIRLHCASPECGGPRIFRHQGEGVDLPPGVGNKNEFITFVCSNCQRNPKTFALYFTFPSRDDTSGACLKFGELPPYGSPTPPPPVDIVR